MCKPSSPFMPAGMTQHRNQLKTHADCDEYAIICAIDCGCFASIFIRREAESVIFLNAKACEWFLQNRDGKGSPDPTAGQRSDAAEGSFRIAIIRDTGFSCG
jgi:hypothetical protein